MRIRIEQSNVYPSVWVSPDGRVFQELAAVPANGYHDVTLRLPGYRGGGQKVRRHRLMCDAYHGPPKPRQVARHLNGKSWDDRPGNLAWGSQADNIYDAINHGTFSLGGKHPRAKLTNTQAIEIKRRREAGEAGKALADEFSVSPQTVCNIFKGRQFNRVTSTKPVGRNKRRV